MVESIRCGEGETTVEAGDGEITLKVERGESELEADLRDGASGEEEETGE